MFETVYVPSFVTCWRIWVVIVKMHGTNDTEHVHWCNILHNILVKKKLSFDTGTRNTVDLCPLSPVQLIVGHCIYSGDAGRFLHCYIPSDARTTNPNSL